MTATAFSPFIAARARGARAGTCMLCGCVFEFACPGGCAWVAGTKERICTAHTDVEIAQARAALRAEDRKHHQRKERTT